MKKVNHSILVLGLAALIFAPMARTAVARPVVSDNELEVSGGFFHEKLGTQSKEVQIEGNTNSEINFEFAGPVG